MGDFYPPTKSRDLDFYQTIGCRFIYSIERFTPVYYVDRFTHLPTLGFEVQLLNWLIYVRILWLGDINLYELIFLMQPTHFEGVHPMVCQGFLSQYKQMILSFKYSFEIFILTILCSPTQLRYLSSFTLWVLSFTNSCSIFIYIRTRGIYTSSKSSFWGTHTHLRDLHPLLSRGIYTYTNTWFEFHLRHWKIQAFIILLFFILPTLCLYKIVILRSAYASVRFKENTGNLVIYTTIYS